MNLLIYQKYRIFVTIIYYAEIATFFIGILQLFASEYKTAKIVAFALNILERIAQIIYQLTQK